MTLPEDSAPQNLGSARPFRLYAKRYLKAGFFPIPLKPKSKSGIPKGFTGHDGKYADKDQIEDWFESYPVSANIALRLQDGVIGIDVDAYKESGDQTLKDLESKFGKLPATWTSSARDDGISGIRLYRVPVGMDWQDNLGAGIDVIQKSHRYVACYPSYNPDAGGQYQWYHNEAPDGDPIPRTVDDELPSPDDLPELPGAWQEHLLRGVHEHVERAEGVEVKQAEAWLKDMPDALGEMCGPMAEHLRLHLSNIESGAAGGAHGGERNGTFQMVRMATEGHRGVLTAINQIREFYTAQVTTRKKGEGNRRTEYDALGELDRSVIGAVAKAMPLVEDTKALVACPCQAAAETLADRARRESAADTDGPAPPPRGRSAEGRAQDPAQYGRHDAGNAEQLMHLVDGDMIWTAALKSWFIWNPACNIWERKPPEAALSRARAIGPRIEAAARLAWDAADEVIKRGRVEEDPELVAEGKAALKEAQQQGKWGEQSQNKIRLTNMLDVMTSFDGSGENEDQITHPVTEFDGNPALLNFNNGVLELYREPEGGRSWHFRDAVREDMCSNSTRIDFDPNATHPLWDDYLETFIPDEDLRWWIQKCMGYAMYGRNFEEKIFFFQGPSRTGKSTIVEALRATMGDYAQPFDLSLFRAKQDAGPRSDIIDVLPRRVIVASEAGQQWHLHVDQIKSMSGGDTLTATAKYSNVPVTGHPAFTPFIATNDPPTVAGADPAMMARIRVVPFHRTVLGQEKFGAREALQDAARGAIMAWLVRGWEGYVAEGIGQKRNHDDAPVAVQTAMEDFGANLNDFNYWLSQETVNGAEHTVQARELFEAYRAWCIDAGIQQNAWLSEPKFAEKMKSQGYEQSRRNIGGGNKAKFYLNIGLIGAKGSAKVKHSS